MILFKILKKQNLRNNCSHNLLHMSHRKKDIFQNKYANDRQFIGALGYNKPILKKIKIQKTISRLTRIGSNDWEHLAT